MSVDFDPVKLGPKRRRIDPLTIGVLAVVVALAVAVVKPWETRPGAPPSPSAIAVAPSTTPSPSPTPVPTIRVVPIAGPGDGAQPPTWADVAPVIETHDTWGVRAILGGRRVTVGLAASPRYLERWSRARADTNGTDTAYVARDDLSLVALGITTPPEVMPEDARVWRVHANDELEWIDARPIVGSSADGAFLFLRFGVAGTSYQTWASGRYRIDVLASDGVHRIAVQVPGRFGSVPAPDEWPATEANLVGPQDSDPSTVRVGLFATADGDGEPLAARTSPLLGEAEAWRDVLDGTRGSQPPVVASAYLPRATGLGVMLTSHASVRLAIVRRLAPDANFLAQPMMGGISESQGRTPYIVFARRGGGAWPPGVYAITVRWTDAGGLHVETWHVELTPGPLLTP